MGQYQEEIIREIIGSIPELNCEECKYVLDAGSGKSSLRALMNSFPNAGINAIVYPGDNRKLDVVNAIANINVTPLERDIAKEEIPEEYDVVLAHLLLGEATKFGNSDTELFKRLMNVKFKYLILIDYLEDPDISWEEIREIIDQFPCEFHTEMFDVPNPHQFETFEGKVIKYFVIRKDDNDEK